MTARRSRAIGRGVLGAAVGVLACLAYVYLITPDVRLLKTGNPATTAFMELRAAETRRAGKEPRRVYQWVPYSRISPHLKRAVTVTEDAAFWQHDGLDYFELRASFERNWREGTVVRGASTITQQLAKNLYLSESRDPVRKLRELIIARRLEAELSKTRIFEMYLNVIEWGDGIYGAEAAARTYFGKPAAALTPSESALLAGAIANPRLLRPDRPTPRLRARQQLTLRRMGRPPHDAEEPVASPPLEPVGPEPAVPPAVTADPQPR